MPRPLTYTPPTCSFEECKEEEVAVEVLTQQATKLFRKCEARLQQFGREPSSSQADEKVCESGVLGGGVSLSSCDLSKHVREVCGYVVWTIVP
jgi:hypothetical protein